MNSALKHQQRFYMTNFHFFFKLKIYSISFLIISQINTFLMLLKMNLNI